MESKSQPTLTDILADLPRTSNKDWLSKILLDLRGKSLEEMDFLLDRQLKVSAFAGPGEHVEIISEGKIKWQNGVIFDLGQENVNANIHVSLNGGCENVILSKGSGKTNVSDALQGVHLGMVGLHFWDLKEASLESTIQELLAINNESSFDNALVQGSLPMQINKDHVPNGLDISSWSKKVSDSFPSMKSICIEFDLTDEDNPNWIEASSQLIASFLNKISELDEMQTSEVLKNTLLSIKVSTNYIVEIVRIQSLKIVWRNILIAAELDPDAFEIESIISANESHGKEDFMIATGPSALACLTAGANHIVIDPRSTEKGLDSALKNRIALNVHHLLKFESGMEEYTNPLKGSYFFENAIKQASELIWEGVKSDIQG